VSGGGPDIDGFEDLVLLARGGFSSVYRASQPSAARMVAIKVLDSTLDDESRPRFERECRALGAVAAHPAICTLYASGETDEGHAYLVMELCRRTLTARIAADGPMGVDEAVRTLLTLAGALEHAHDLGILHRDVKPENVLETQFGQLVLTDFGIARVADGFHTATGLVTASVAHAAPEVLDGDEPTAASDVYSLASTGYHLLTGSPPFRRPGEPSSAMVARIFRDPPPDLRERAVPDGVAAALEAALAKDPAERTPDMASFAAALRAGAEIPASSGGATVARPARRAALRPLPVDGAAREDDTQVEATRATRAAPAAPPAQAAGGRSGPGSWLAILAVVLVVAAIGLGAFLLMDAGDDSASPSPSSTTTTSSPTTSTTADLGQERCVHVSDGELNVRSGPSTSAEVLFFLTEGTCGVFDAVPGSPEVVRAGGGLWRHVHIVGVAGQADPTDAWVFDEGLQEKP
jgi:hypothetical protein